MSGHATANQKVRSQRAGEVMLHAGSVMALLSREAERNCFIKVAEGRASARMCDIERENVQNYAPFIQQVHRQQEASIPRIDTCVGSEISLLPSSAKQWILFSFFS